MSTMQRLTLIGLYNYEQTFERDLFSGLELPEHYDKPTFINALLLEHGEKCVMYSDPNFFKSAINIWSKKWALELSRIYDALIAEYNPIYNYDRYEDWTEIDKPDVTTTRTHNDTDTRTNDNTDTRTNDNTDTQTLGNTLTRTHNDTDTRTNNNTDTQTNRYDIVTEQNVDGFNEHTVSADNSSSYQPESKDTSNSGKATQSNDGTITDAHTGTITDAHTGTITDANSGTISDAHTGTITDAHTGTITDAHTGTISDREAGVRSDVTHSGHIQGNIGVTTSTQMVSEVVKQRFEMNLYGIATKLFANELLIGIY